MSTTPKQTAPDVRQLAAGDLPENAFPAGRNQPFRVFIEPSVHEQVWKHATENAGVEICGVAVGKWVRDADGPYVLISESIRGEAATNKFAEVTFTHDTWAKINEQMDSRFSHLSIVGWYHSHPDFGVFLSDRDRFIQENFFSGAGQIAYVVDPVRRTEGVFVWKEGKPTLVPHYWVGDRIQVATAAGNEKVEPAPVEPAPGSATGQAVPSRSRGQVDWLTFGSQIALALLLLLVGYLGGRMLAGRVNDAERERIRQEANEHYLQHWAVVTVRPGLRQEANRLRDVIEVAMENTGILARQHLKLLENPKETGIKWAEGVLVPLESVRRGLGDMKAIYGLTPDEEKYLESLARGKPKPQKEKARPSNKKKDKNKKGKAKDKKKSAKDRKSNKEE
jgi:proteasome lid subunit RPN8/RPN11